MAAHQILHEDVDVAIGGGLESITASAQVKADPQFTVNPWVSERNPGVYMVMGDTAEVVAKRYKISREAQDQYALSSQERTARAQREGFFDEELAPIDVTRAILDKKTGQVVGQEECHVARDECNRPDTTLEGLLSLKPYFDPKSGAGQRDGGQRVAALRRRLGHAADGRDRAGRWASSRRSRSAGSPWPRASPTRWASAPCSPCPSC